METEESRNLNAVTPPEAALEAVKDAVPEVAMQHVVIVLADGRRGVFMGQMLVKAIEIELGAIPDLVGVHFDKPKVFKRPEAPNADQEAKPVSPAPGLV